MLGLDVQSSPVRQARRPIIRASTESRRTPAHSDHLSNSGRPTSLNRIVLRHLVCFRYSLLSAFSIFCPLHPSAHTWPGRMAAASTNETPCPSRLRPGVLGRSMSSTHTLRGLFSFASRTVLTGPSFESTDMHNSPLLAMPTPLHILGRPRSVAQPRSATSLVSAASTPSRRPLGEFSHFLARVDWPRPRLVLFHCYCRTSPSRPSCLVGPP